MAEKQDINKIKSMQLKLSEEFAATDLKLKFFIYPPPKLLENNLLLLLQTNTTSLREHSFLYLIQQRQNRAHYDKKKKNEIKTIPEERFPRQPDFILFHCLPGEKQQQQS